MTNETPLFKAIISKRLKIVKFLIKMGVNVESENINKDTALFFILHLKKNIPYCILKEVLLCSKVSQISSSWNLIPTINTASNIFHLLAKKQTYCTSCDWDFTEIMRIIHTKTSIPCINDLNGIYLTPIIAVLIYNPFNHVLINEFLKYNADIWKECSGTQQLLNGTYILGKDEYRRLKRVDLYNCLNQIRWIFKDSSPVFRELQWNLPSEMNRLIRGYLTPSEKLLSGVSYWNNLPNNVWENILQYAIQ